MCARQPFNTLKRLNLSREPRTQRSQESTGNTSNAIEKGSKIPLTTDDMQALSGLVCTGQAMASFT